MLTWDPLTALLNFLFALYFLITISYIFLTTHIISKSVSFYSAKHDNLKLLILLFSSFF